jgi:hypothetical protein
MAGVIPAWSYSFLNEYQICPKRTWHKYIGKDVKHETSAAAEWGNKVHAALDKAIGTGSPLSGDTARYAPWASAFAGQPVETEVRLGLRQDGSPCGWYDDDCAGRSKLDLILTPGDATIRLFDWKTGKVREDNFELRVQAVFAQARNPEARQIWGWYVWLGEGPTGKLGEKHDLTDIETTWAEIDSRLHHIRTAAADNRWPAREGPMCRFCPVKTCEFNKTP